MLSHQEAKRVANAHLRAVGSVLVAVRAARERGVWVVSYQDPADPDAGLEGGGLVVTDSGDVHDLSSAPGSLDMLVLELGIWPRHPDTDLEAVELLADIDPGEAEGLRALKKSRQRERGEH
ncbi:hypothetical protein [Pedococcus soli]